MYNLHLSHSLAKKMSIKAGVPGQSVTTKLGDWYARDIRIFTQHLILCTNGATRLSVLVDAAPYKDLPKRLPAALAEVLRAIGISADQIHVELSEMKEVHISKSSDRSVIGTMNEFVDMIKYDASVGRLDRRGLRAMSLKLSEVPIVALNLFPDLATCKIFGAPRPERRNRYMEKPATLRLLRNDE